MKDVKNIISGILESSEQGEHQLSLFVHYVHCPLYTQLTLSTLCHTKIILSSEIFESVEK